MPDLPAAYGPRAWNLTDCVERLIAVQRVALSQLYGPRQPCGTPVSIDIQRTSQTLSGGAGALAPATGVQGTTAQVAKAPDGRGSLYLIRSGCAWRMLPSSFPPWPTVFTHFRSWRIDGTLRRMHDRLRALAREAAGRNAEPSAAIIDSQTVRATGVGGPARGYDAAKRTAGRKRHILVDAAGLILLAHVHEKAITSGRP